MTHLQICYILFCLLSALNVADLVITAIGLKSGQIEGNAYMKKFMDMVGVVPAMVILKGIMLFFIWYIFDRLYPSEPTIPYALLVFCSIYAYIVYRNVRIMKNG